MEFFLFMTVSLIGIVFIIPILLFYILNGLIYIIKRIRWKRYEINAKHYLIYEDINFFFGDYIRPAIKCVPELLKLDILNKEDLYIDLTGGDERMGLSDDKLIELRKEQNCMDIPLKSKISIFDKTGNFNNSYSKKTGKWIFCKYPLLSTRDYRYKWNTLTYSWENKKYGIFKKGYMYIDKGSGDRVSKEWNDKLEKLVKAYKVYKNFIHMKEVNSIISKFKEIEKD